MSTLLQTANATIDSSALTPPPDGDGHFAAKMAYKPGGIVSSCSECGSDVIHPYLKDLQEAQIRITELEQQIQILTLRATSAMEKATEYETSLKRMNSLSSAGRSTPEPAQEIARAPSPIPRSETPTNEIASPERSTSRLARLLPTRMPSLRSATSSPSLATSSPLSRVENPPTSLPSPPDSQAPSSGSVSQPPSQFPLLSHTPPTPKVDPSTLMDQLSQEQERRRAAEAEATKTKGEIEELTSQLFEQANEMVAAERKARTRLEARVEVLERRDGEKAKRLGMLESRVQRVERVRGLLAESSGSVTRTVSVDRANASVREVGVKA